MFELFFQSGILIEIYRIAVIWVEVGGGGGGVWGDCSDGLYFQFHSSTFSDGSAAIVNNVLMNNVLTNNVLNNCVLG